MKNTTAGLATVGPAFYKKGTNMHKYDSHPEEAQPLKGVPLENKKPPDTKLPPQKLLPMENISNLFKKNAIK